MMFQSAEQHRFQPSSESPELLDDSLKVQRPGVVTRHGGGAGQVQAEIELIGAGTKVAARRDSLAEQLQASGCNTDTADSARGKRRIGSSPHPALNLGRGNEVGSIDQCLSWRAEPADQSDRGAGVKIPGGGEAYRGKVVRGGIIGNACDRC